MKQPFHQRNIVISFDIPKSTKTMKVKIILKAKGLKPLKNTMKTRKLYCHLSENIGQVKIEEADKEIQRLNAGNENVVWRKDFSEYMEVLDESDPDIQNPCKLSEGYCWVTCVPEFLTAWHNISLLNKTFFSHKYYQKPVYQFTTDEIKSIMLQVKNL